MARKSDALDRFKKYMESLSRLSVSSQIQMKIIQSNQRDLELMVEENTPPKNSNIFAKVMELSRKL